MYILATSGIRIVLATIVASTLVSCATNKGSPGKENPMVNKIELRPYIWDGPYSEMRPKGATPHDPGLCADARAPWMAEGDRLILRTSEIIGYDTGYFYDDHFPTQELDTRGKTYRHLPFGWNVSNTPDKLEASCKVPGKGWFGLTMTSHEDTIDIEMAVRNESTNRMEYVDWYFCAVGYESASIGDQGLERTHIFDGSGLRTLAEIRGGGVGEEMILVDGPGGADGFMPNLHGSHKRSSTRAAAPLVMIRTVDGTHTAALGFERAHSRFSSTGNKCFHADPFFGLGLDPGEEWTIKGRLYLMEGTPEDALARFRREFDVK
jgi:hypothetical protein